MGDTTRRVILTVGAPALEHEWTLSTDPGWTTEDQWAFGQPSGQGGEHGFVSLELDGLAEEFAAIARFRGMQCGVHHAEAFRVCPTAPRIKPYRVLP